MVKTKPRPQRRSSGIFRGLAYDDIGEGAAVFLIHGLTYDRRIWAPILDRLGNAIRCVVIDLPGHGGSAMLPSHETTIRFRSRNAFIA